MAENNPMRQGEKPNLTPFRTSNYREIRTPLNSNASNENNVDKDINDDEILVWNYGIGPFRRYSIKRFSKSIAQWGLIPLGISALIGVLLLLGMSIDYAIVKVSLLVTLGFYSQAFWAYHGEQSYFREIKNRGKVYKNRLPLGSLLGFPGFLLMVFGLVQYSQLGIWSGVFVFIGSTMTLAGFILINNDKSSASRMLRKVIMWFLALPVIIALFGFIGMVGGVIGMVFS